MSNDHPAETFLGLTKTGFVGIIAICLVLAVIIGGANVISTVRSNQSAVEENEQAIADIESNSAELARLAELAAEDHVGLCAFIADLDKRVDANRELLRTNQGPMIFGIPREVIEQSVSSQGATLNALRPIDCTNVKP